MGQSTNDQPWSGEVPPGKKSPIMGSSEGKTFDFLIDEGTKQNLPCSNYSDDTASSIEFFLTEDHLQLRRIGLGMQGLTMLDVSPVSEPGACQKIRNLIAANEEMQKPVSQNLMQKLVYTPHFYKVGSFYVVVYQPNRLTFTWNNIFIIDSDFNYLRAVTI